MSIVIPFSGTFVGLVSVTTLPEVPPVMFNLDDAAVPKVVVSEMGFSTDHLTGAATVTVTTWLTDNPILSVTVIVSRYVPVATREETTKAAPLAVDVSIENPDLTGVSEKVRVPEPPDAVKVSLRPPTPAPTLKVVGL